MTSLALAAVAGLITIGTGAVNAEVHHTWADAKAAAEASGKPVLVDFFATWCGPCKAFTAEYQASPEFSGAIGEHVVFMKTDAEKGEGLEMARRYAVYSYPNFVLLDEDGQLMDRWAGYGGSERFLESLTAAMDSPMPLMARLQQFRKTPTEIDARRIADLRANAGLYGEAIAWNQRADALGDEFDDYDGRNFDATSDGVRWGLFTNDDVMAAADAVVNSSSASAESKLHVAMTIGYMTRRSGDTETYVKYLKPAIEGSADIADEASYAARMRRELMIDYAMHVEKDVDRAVEAKRVSMPEGWMDNPQALNSFAWWCFENQTNLDEAEQLARRGVELADAGKDKANVLDTLAEICNLKGDCGDAVELMRQAVAADPENNYFKEQLARFEELLAQQKRG